MREICLYNLEQAGLILLEESGCVLFNQVGGLGYRRRQATGVFAPISNDPLVDADRDQHLDALLAAAVRGDESLTATGAAALDDALMSLSSTDLLSVDRARLSESEPGWVYVQLVPNGEFSQFSSPLGRRRLTMLS